ncbi:hypothetical protein [Micromonospora sagamiensis]|uniref:Uncharacterized protein n=1 Tax=Micromonospora sagamiensis TaxID=47875 RepID=A0A562WL33_9ACTN|nr:hypothetical protein [Micromonospora sagamiensis]TWJ30898.1 hypothetical protein JD81_04447 [Micromonospora sagamiensis]BCL16063.1 hypothetical protein GCM10017556_38020 [Micromonospora sagamiensis]
MTPQHLLDQAADLLVNPRPSMRRCWQRGSACLTRVALEQGMRDYWSTIDVNVGRCRMSRQLLALRAFAGDETALIARTAWHGLSRAMHHHTYELAPTLAELRGWHRDVTDLLPRLKP